MARAERDRSRNPEVVLVPLMAAVADLVSRGRMGAIPGLLDARARELGFGSWAEYYATLPQFRRTLTGGSPNHQAMASAIGLYHPETFDRAVASWRICAETEPDLGFEREEPGSRIYGPWSLESRMLVAAHPEAPTDLKSYARDWLAMFWCLGALSAIPFGGGYRSLRCGARSQGAFGPMKSDVALTIAMRGEPSFQKSSGFPPFWRKTPEVAAILALRAIVMDSAPAHLGAYPPSAELALNAAPSWTSQATTWYMRTTAGVAVWLDEPEKGEDNDDVKNSNTPGMAAMGYDENGIWSLPPPSRDHVRQKKVVESVRTRWRVDEPKVPSSLDYSQGGAGRSMSIHQRLPGGEVIYLIRHGRDGIWRIPC